MNPGRDRGYDDHDDYSPTVDAAAASARRHAIDLDDDWRQPDAAELEDLDREARHRRARQNGWGRR